MVPNITTDYKANARRQFILDEMLHLGDKKINCSQCRGPCCTFEANSMQITVLEAVEITQYLNQNNRIDSNLILQLHETIKNYRLDSYQGTGKTSIRKTYTCPFFNETDRKCTISRQAKPIGCLGFNPIETNITNGGSCRSNLDLLKKREEVFYATEKEINDQLKKELNIFWDKAPIPIAILAIVDASNK